MTSQNPASSLVFEYHERTKHRFQGYARGPETIDWDAQPDPFRRYLGAPQRKLPLRAGTDHDTADVRAWNERSVSNLLLFSLGLTAWKQYGTARWSLRCNPSSGNLHPTEAYLFLIGIESFENGLYHYRPDNHSLELRARHRLELGRQAPLLLVGFSSVHWREAWKYGERAFRYCHLDLGHALAALSYSARLRGFHATPLLDPGDDALQSLMGLDRADEFFADEIETADMLLAIHPSDARPDFSVESLRNACTQWFGRANRLDPDHHYQWPVIEEVARATRRPANRPSESGSDDWSDAQPGGYLALSSREQQKLILRRRSAQAFDPSVEIPAGDFFRILDRLLPRKGFSPWTAQSWPSRIHLVLFVHGVEGLAPGLYILLRKRAGLDAIKAALRDDFLWEAVPEAPRNLPFYRLVRAKARQAAMRLSCHQAIAGNSAFSLAMLAEFEAAIDQAAWHYNEIFWEAGMLGQTLYLEAEAIRMRGTGIGCFFDDEMHTLLGIRGRGLQVVYHFTLGAAIHDSRIATLPPYPMDAELG